MLEDLTRAAATHGKATVVVQLVVPVKTKELVLFGQDWNESEGRLNVGFSKVGSGAAGQDDTDRIVDRRVVHLGFVVGNALVDRVTSGTGQVDNQPEFPRGLLFNNADRVQVEEGEKRLGERAAEAT